MKVNWEINGVKLIPESQAERSALLLLLGSTRIDANRDSTERASIGREQSFEVIGADMEICCPSEGASAIEYLATK
jgi:hypothetical protein